MQQTPRQKTHKKNTIADPSERARLLSLTKYEQDAFKEGNVPVAGIDEAGRGPLAGPVVAAACIIPPGLLLEGVNDSKLLSPTQRKALFERYTQDERISYGVGIVSHEEIDRINILQATIVAMLQAIERLNVQPRLLLVDGLHLPHPSISCLKIIKGDRLSQSIALASIIAKETRDRLMQEYHVQWPEYHFHRHMGYGTALHREALLEHGPCPIHRKTFEPIKSL